MSKLPERSAGYGVPLQEMGILYKETLQRHIELACIWLLNAPLAAFDTLLPSVALKDPGREDPVYNYLSDTPPSAFDRVWYYTIILWYTLHHCPDTLKSPEAKELLHSRMSSLENVRISHKIDDPKCSLLMWYHYSCFLRICKIPETGDSASFFINRPQDDFIAVQENIWKNKAQRRLKPAGKRRSNRALEDYHVANLALLAEELFSNPADTTSLPNPCVSYAKEFIQSRDWTTTINPGKEDRKQANNTVQNTLAPWELVSLNHHSLLRPEVSASEEEIDAALDACQEFLLADYTFIGSWDSSDKFMVSSWWDLLSSSILSATLLDRRLKLQDNEGRDLTQEEKLHGMVEGIETTDVKDVSSNQPGPILGVLGRKPSIGIREDTTDDVIKRLLDELGRVTTKQAEEREEFDWRSRRPQRICFPDTFTQSLEDTPELFQSKHLKNVSIRSNVKNYL